MRFVKLLSISAFIFGGLIFLLSLIFPSTAVVERTGVIQAPVDSVYKHINNLREWESWNPWTRPDTTATLVYAANPVGVGAWYSWEGQLNKGKVTITGSDRDKGVHYTMDIQHMRPVKGGIEVKATVDGKATAIFWHMEIKLGLAPWWKLRGFLSDRIYGPSMDQGLTELSRICEKR
ncbi:SRPBCC family protein [Chitinophaga nivalis]|uniref:SRPBCC family protein n=1 Tax=Chitinophaga nivalis TaxID=2991709 RepID=A0ABT3IQI1_9BACT|nr:SRPBCC family protein [Chitinophaga nivalis]MCW3464097.1 SRPBCC family protein [Chitinophaga nivalis]MCW3486213.1 SRPBCC family protein [Chitinophaga nivalis]